MLTLKKDLLERMIKHAKKEFPNEACGILGGKEAKVKKVYAMTNVEKSPSTFFMDAKEQLKAMKELRNLGLDLLGIYHSHGASSAYPSPHDVELALYPEAAYLIISLMNRDNPQVRSFRITDGQITEEELKIEE